MAPPSIASPTPPCHCRRLLCDLQLPPPPSPSDAVAAARDGRLSRRLTTESSEMLMTVGGGRGDGDGAERRRGEPEGTEEATVVASMGRAEADQNAEDIVASALACFNDRYVYSSCQESYRLNAGGTLNVPREATDGYCGGPCLTETKLVLSCVDNILYNFRFYNGASVRDVRYTLDAGCGHTRDFNVNEHLDDDIDAYGGCYDHGDRLAVRVYLLILFSCVLLL
ncbi:hypothetical protein MUK42_12091 [Musa troglodytarum]|uniref:DUF7731 domain-containing protein n=1 Tax=Musa troglodytarum TaxID=320322 RepID=A0A9E7GQY0_9LILI|nr:hypothetical protein MUK42_12091 [Musa troglodytarum]